MQLDGKVVLNPDNSALQLCQVYNTKNNTIENKHIIVVVK